MGWGVLMPTIIEVALNGPWGRERQPGMPITVDACVAEGIEAVDRGAGILHVHAYDADTGRQNDDWRTYARIIEGIRARHDVIVYPTIPLAGSGYAGGVMDAAARFAHVGELGRRGLLEMAALDPGTVNFERNEAGAPGFVYLNPPDHVGEGLRLSALHGLRPGYAIYEPGFTRAGAVRAAEYPGLATPLYRFMFSDGFAWGFPPRARYLEAHLALLAEAAPKAAWMVAGLMVDIRPLLPEAIARGGHLRVGLEDAPWGTALSNAAWTDAAVAAIRAAGSTPASPREARGILAATDFRK